MDFDAIIVGGGPAGLTAGTLLAKANYRVLLLEKESFGGQLMKVEWINGYPATGARVSGAELASEMIGKAEDAGVEMEQAEVVEIESYSECKSVICAEGEGYTAAVIILAGGVQPKKLGIPGEEKLQGKGMIHCAICDAVFYKERVVAVCGGGDAGVIEALHLAQFASKIILIEAQSDLTAKPHLRERARSNPKLEFRFNQKPVAVIGDSCVTGIRVENTATGLKEVLDVSGVLVQAGLEPTASYVKDILPLDDQGYPVANADLATEIPGIVVAGDIRRESTRRVASAVSDGAAAAAVAQRFLEMTRETSA